MYLMPLNCTLKMGKMVIVMWNLPQLLLKVKKIKWTQRNQTPGNQSQSQECPPSIIHESPNRKLPERPPRELVDEHTVAPADTGMSRSRDRKPTAAPLTASTLSSPNVQPRASTSVYTKFRNRQNSPPLESRGGLPGRRGQRLGRGTGAFGGCYSSIPSTRPPGDGSSSGSS